jgi:poly(ADP-ribose) glycohydrolase
MMRLLGGVHFPKIEGFTFIPFLIAKRIHSQLTYQKNIDRIKVEKLKCLLHYFERVTNKSWPFNRFFGGAFVKLKIKIYLFFKNLVPSGVVTFSRNHFTDAEIPNFRLSTKPMRAPLVRLNGTIEDCTGALQLDFANKYLGGGVLNHGCVQEEIRFLVSPELMVSMLFTEYLTTNESVVIRGTERFSSYTGYASSFEWLDDYEDKTARDEFNRLYTDICAIDALKYHFYKGQFAEGKIVRELRKAYSGFRCKIESSSAEKKYPVIATGNWGCGAFKGDRQLKCKKVLKYQTIPSSGVFYA